MTDFIGVLSTSTIVQVIESSASAAANKILDLLDVNTNKRWSGPEFFGFTKPDVARELMKDSEHFLPEHFNKRKKFMDEKNASTNQAIEVRHLLSPFITFYTASLLIGLKLCLGYI